MEGRAGDSTSWVDLVTHAEAGSGACKRKKTDAGQQTPSRSFPLASEEVRKEAMGIIHDHMKDVEASQRNIASRAITAYYQDFTPAAVERGGESGTLYDRRVASGLCHQGLCDDEPHSTRGSLGWIAEPMHRHLLSVGGIF